MLIQEAKRLQKLAGIKEEQGHYYTSTDDPKTVQLHLTTDEKPSLSKNYKPLSPKSQRKDELTPEAIKKALIASLRNNKMDYEKSITIVSDKFNIDKDSLKQDFPKNDMLYKSSIDEVVNEALRKFRITEAEEAKVEQNIENDTEIDAAMKAGLSALTSGGESLDEIKDEEQPKELNESIVGLIGSSLLAAPKIVEWIGKAIGFISKPFMKDKDENEIAKKIEHFGHKWEKLYLKAIIWVVKKTKFAQQLWLTPDKKIDEQKLLVVAKYIYAGILALAVGNAIKTVLGSASPVIKAIETSLGGIKAGEIATIASKVKGQL
jgi:hypothetical protein